MGEEVGPKKHPPETKMTLPSLDWGFSEGCRLLDVSVLLNSWNFKQQFLNGCFIWMIPNLYLLGKWLFSQTSIKRWLSGVPGLDDVTNRFKTSAVCAHVCVCVCFFLGGWGGGVHITRGLTCIRSGFSNKINRMS